MEVEAGETDAQSVIAAITVQPMQMAAHYAKRVNQRKLAASAVLNWK